MHKLDILIILQLLPIVIVGKSRLVVHRIINNEQIPLTQSRIDVPAGEDLELICYINVTLNERSYRRYGVNWITPSYTDHIQKLGSVLTIRGINRLDRGHYQCVAQKPFLPVLSQKFYLMVHDKIDPYVYDYRRVEIPEQFTGDHVWSQSELYLPNMNAYDDASVNTAKVLIFFGVSGALLLLVSLMYMYQCLRNSNDQFEEFHSVKCQHRLCSVRRRTHLSSSCLLQNIHST